jgi:4-hydroxymandelate oxidase
MEQFENLSDVRARWEQVADADLVDWLSGGEPGATSMRNEDAFEDVAVRQRVLVDVSQTDLTCSALGYEIAMPIMLAPTGGQHRVHPDAELASARAAGRRGTVIILSSFSTHSVEEVMQVAGGPVWFQLYWLRDRGVTKQLVERAEQCGCGAIVLTVDVNARSREWFRMPDEWADTMGSFRDMGLKVPAFKSLDPSLTWDDLEWLREVTSLPIVIKGVQLAEDARRCVARGAAGIAVSNHGGYTLAGASASLEFLPEIVEAAGDQAEVYFDGGIRRGTDILKALGLGARAVLIGRPMLWGLGAGGDEGVERVLEILTDELEEAMILCGVPDLAAARDVAVRFRRRRGSAA